MPVEVAPRPPGSRPSPAAGSGGLARALSAGRALPWRPVLLSFVAARIVVLLALLVAQLLHLRDGDLRTEGLLGWDAAWYERIAGQGYDPLPAEALRFFPLLPLLARGLAPLLLGSEGAALLVLSNGGAIAFGLLLHRLAVREGLGEAVAGRAVWAAAFAPAAFVQVMGYTEPLYGALVCGLLLAVRSRRWMLVGLLGALAGALRPPGVLLAVVVLVEACAGLRAAGARERLARLAAVLAPAAGLGGYLLWVRLRYGDALLPFRAQVEPDLRGGAFVDPLPGVVDALRGLLTGQLAGSGLHVAWAIVALALLVVVWRHLPLSYVALAGLTVLLGMTARSMTSFERYAGSAVPLLLGAAILTASSRVRSTTMWVAPVLLAVYATMAFLHLYVP
ncbi:MAG TPA: hypothetical protein VFR07_06100 [Mycobacteriales bacterium]|nr:hypothetical protein [Mycobacteriales bacterium]